MGFPGGWTDLGLSGTPSPPRSQSSSPPRSPATCELTDTSTLLPRRTPILRTEDHQRRLKVVPLTLREANEYIEAHHRHHGRVVGHRFSIAVVDGEYAGVQSILGIAVVGRPVSRGFNPRMVAEVTRLCTDGALHVASKLYAACWRACRALGFESLVTYTLDSESGTSVRAAGWYPVWKTRGGSWSTDKRPRVDKAPMSPKILWAAPGSRLPRVPRTPIT